MDSICLLPEVDKVAKEAVDINTAKYQKGEIGDGHQVNKNSNNSRYHEGQ